MPPWRALLLLSLVVLQQSQPITPALAAAAAPAQLTGRPRAPPGDDGAPAPPNAGKIKHFVTLLMENRAFDHLFGCMGLDGVDGIPPEGRTLYADPVSTQAKLPPPQLLRDISDRLLLSTQAPPSST